LGKKKGGGGLLLIEVKKSRCFSYGPRKRKKRMLSRLSHSKRGDLAFPRGGEGKRKILMGRKKLFLSFL